MFYYFAPLFLLFFTCRLCFFFVSLCKCDYPDHLCELFPVWSIESQSFVKAKVWPSRTSMLPKCDYPGHSCELFNVWSTESQNLAFFSTTSAWFSWFLNEMWLILFVAFFYSTNESFSIQRYFASAFSLNLYYYLFYCDNIVLL